MFEHILPARTVVGVLRGDSPDGAFELAAAAIEAGLSSVEVTFTLPDAARVMAQLVREYGARCSIGAGTVLSVEHVDAAAAAGASYLVSPHLDLRLVQAIASTGLPYVPGVMTPTELRIALDAGCEMVKVFPVARLGGPAYVRDLRGPFPDVQIMATGGVRADDAAEYFSAGARAVGLGAAFGRDVQETSERTLQVLRAGRAGN